MWWAVAAVAGPLDRPDANEMEGYRCRYRPVAIERGADLKDRELLDLPPGPPEIEAPLELAALPTDADLRRAARGRGNHTLPAVATLATGGIPALLGCSVREPTFQDDFTVGCRRLAPCELVIQVEDEGHKVAWSSQVGPVLHPITSVSEALGLVALLDHSVFVPLTEGERRAWDADAPRYLSVVPQVPWVEIEQHTEGWLVRAPRRALCGGCRDVVRRAWWVANDGRSCQLDEAPVVLARDRDGPCAEGADPRSAP